MAQIKYKKISKELLKLAVTSKNAESEDASRSSVNTSIDVLEHYQIDVDRLIPYHKQARRTFNEEEINNLSISIKEHGLRQPLTVIQSIHDDKKYEVVSGERRLRAAKIAGLKKVPCIMISDHEIAEEIALVENIQRQDLHPIELGEAFFSLLNKRKGMTQIELSEKIGVSNKVISEALQYAKLPDSVKNILISQNTTNREFLRKLLRVKDPLTVLQKQGKSQESIIETKKSLIRINMVGKSIHVQSNALNKLDNDEKKMLKNKLEEILKSL